MMCWQQHLQERGLAVNHIVQLGLGAASLSKYCYRECPTANITVVELNPQVIAACRQFFKLPQNDSRLKVVQASADAWVNDAKHHGTADVLQVDIYDSEARGPVFDSEAFYAACRACLSPQGVMTVNVFGGEAMTGGKQGGFKVSYANISAAFEGRCTALPQVDAGNVVVMAWNA
jgi:spermidine synthase